MPRRCCFLSIIVLLAVTSTAFGGIRPSFSLDHSAWTADVIVVCLSSSEPGRFTVSESLRGSLLPGQRLYLPELVPEKGARPLSEYPPYSHKGLAENIPRLSPGERVILFLDGSGVSTNASGPLTGWRPSGVFRDMKTSVLWLDGRSIWMFRQGNNPGPSLLIKSDVSESAVRRRIAEILNGRERLRDAVAEGCSTRPSALKTLVKEFAIYVARVQILSEIEKCGSLSIPILFELADDPKLENSVHSIMETLSRFEGELVGPGLVDRLKAETGYWRGQGDGLRAEWWNDLHDPRTAPRRASYSRIVALVRAIGTLRYSPGLSAVEGVRDVFSALGTSPNTANGQLVEEASQAVKRILADSASS